MKLVEIITKNFTQKTMEQNRARAAAVTLPLHSQSPYISRRATAFNRLFAAVYAAALSALFYHHLTSLLNPTSFFVSVSLFLADVVLALFWAATQCNRINPVRRREFPANLNELVKDSDFPALDVFVCTADPYKEPPINVVNTALSVLAYDYPPRKLSVYVSDDGGSAVTLFAFMEAAKFAAVWLPFCRKNDVVERNPDAFFTSDKDCNTEKENIKIMYEKMKMRVEMTLEKGRVGDELFNGEEDRIIFYKWTKSFTRQNHPTIIQVLLEGSKSRDIIGESLPNLIYVSRQKSQTSHHHFKAGALNALLRVSAVMTNAPIILTLDCDTYSNDPQTPNRILCYFLDSKFASNLSYIQFPQRFHGVSKNDIYACEFKRLYIFNPAGMDGFLGPAYLGTACFFARRAFFGGPLSFEPPELLDLGPNHVVERPIKSQEVLDLAHVVAGCEYENDTKWGSKLGFRYGSLVEDYFTGYILQSEGWKSIFCNPNRVAFYGDVPMNLLDAVNQAKRWAVGLLEVAFSKHSPITFGLRYLGLLMGLCYSHNIFWPFLSIPVTIYAFLPQLALIHGTSIFPKVTDPWFLLYAFLFLGAYGQDLLEFHLEGSSFKNWWNDQRIWSIRSFSSYLFASIEFSLKSLGISAFGFNVTSKVVDQEQSKRYEQELFEFGTSSPMFVPIATAAMVNLVGFISGLIGILRSGRAWEEVLAQMFVAGFVVVNCWPLYEAMLFRKDGGKLPFKITFLSFFIALLLCSFAVFLY